MLQYPIIFCKITVLTQKPWTRFLGVGFNLAAAVLFGFFLGYWADKKLGTQPWLMLAGAVVGMGAGFYGFIRESLEK